MPQSKYAPPGELGNCLLQCGVGMHGVGPFGQAWGLGGGQQSHAIRTKAGPMHRGGDIDDGRARVAQTHHVFAGLMDLPRNREGMHYEE
jgi:hypothetical protein